MCSEASGRRMTRALQSHIEYHRKLLKIGQEVRCGAPQNAGSGLNGAVSFGLNRKSDSAQNKNARRCARNNPLFTNQKQVSRHDAFGLLATNPDYVLVPEIGSHVQARMTI